MSRRSFGVRVRLGAAAAFMPALIEATQWEGYVPCPR
jgi:hypothetical protein